MDNLPTLKMLRYLVVLHQHLNFGRAAEACHISQSTLSASISNFEELLATQLVERNNRKILFTHIGEQVVDQAQKILLQSQDLLHIAQQSKQPLSGEIRLGCIPTIAPFLLPALIAMVRSSFPQLKLSIKEDLTERLSVDLDHGDIDIALLALPFAGNHFASYSLGQDPFFLACHRQQREQFCDLENFDQLPDSSLLLLEDGHCLRDHALSACGLQNNSPINTFAATSLHTLVQMVNQQLGVTFLPKIAIDQGITNGTQVITQALKGDNNARELGLVWRKSSTRSQEFYLFGEHVTTLLNH